MDAAIATPNPQMRQRPAATGRLDRNAIPQERRRQYTKPLPPYGRQALEARAWGSQSPITLVCYGLAGWDRCQAQHRADERDGFGCSASVWTGDDPAAVDWRPFATQCVLLIGDPAASAERLEPLAKQLLAAGAGEVLAPVAGGDARHWRAEVGQ